MAVTYHTFSTAGRMLFSTDGSASVMGETEEKLLEWLGEICDPVLDASSIVTGSGYQDGTYADVELIRTATTQTGGKNLKATVVISGGGVSSVTMTTKGNGFKTGDFVKIKDLSEVGGTGSGFQMQISSANAEFGLVRGLDDRSNLSAYEAGWQLGCERGAGYDFGTFFYKSSNSTTMYVRDVYSYANNSPTSQNGYGSYSYQQNESFSTWAGGQQDSTVALLYCNDPGNEFFIYVDSLYSGGWGVMKAVQDPATPEKYPSRAAFSPWTSFYIQGGTMSVRALTTAYYNTEFVGPGNRLSPHYPVDAKCLFNDACVYGRAYITGSYPDRIYSHANTDQGWGHVYQDGVDTYRRVSTRMYVKTN